LDRRWQLISHYKVQHGAQVDALDKLIASVADFFDFPIALVTLLSQEQWFVAKVGIEVDFTRLENSFCRHVVAQKKLFIVEDASNHPDFQHNPLVTGMPGIRFYAGVPLRMDGKEVGAVCLIDTKPNSLSARDLCFFEKLSYFVSDYVALIDQRVNPRPDYLFEKQFCIPDAGGWVWNTGTGIIHFNQQWFRLLGMTPTTNNKAGLYCLRYIHCEDYTHFKIAVDNHLLGITDAINIECRIQHGSGHWLWCDVNGRVIENDVNGKPLWVMGTVRDISDKKNAELRERKQLCLLNFINRAQSVFLREKDIRKSCGLIFEDLLRLADSEFGLIGQVIEYKGVKSLFIHALSNVCWNGASEIQYEAYEKGELYFTNLNNLFGHVVVSGDVILTNDSLHHAASRGAPAGHPSLKRFLGLPIKVDGVTIGMIGLANKKQDYTDDDVVFFQPLLDTLGVLFSALEIEKSRCSVEQTLRYLAETDVLTQLPNRRTFINRIEALYLQPERPFTLAIIDIDYFKAINDQYGHQAGDEVLVEIAMRLKNSLQPIDLIARMGGEEFGLCVHGTSPEATLELLRMTVAKEPVTTSDGAIMVTVSIGAYHVHAGAVSQRWEADLKCADSALYRAKKAGRNRVEWFKRDEESEPTYIA
jgi:diguanylate cyclase (GGDEF)-like protein/PAS domain S-box-containing protein